MPENVRLKDNKGKLELVGSKIMRMEIDTTSVVKNNNMYLEFDYNGNTYKQFLNVPISDSIYDVSFFPEGGYLPVETLCRIGFKALRPDGLGEAVSGIVLNDKGDTLTRFESNVLGMGVFPFYAKENETYYAICRNKNGFEQKFKLPAAEKNAISLQATKHNNLINFSLQYSKNKTLSDSIYILLHCRGWLLYAKPWNKTCNYICFDNKTLPSGILHAILVDSQMNPISERLVFNYNPKDIAEVNISTDKDSYQKREKITVNTVITDNNGYPISANYSVAVTDDRIGLPDSSNTILTTMLLTSDLKGYIENPEWYFSKKGVIDSELDLLMLTQGWRRYDISALLKGDIKEPNIDFEYSEEIRGTVTGGLLNKPIIGANISLFTMDFPFVKVTSTDSNGIFLLNGFEFPEKTSYMLKGTNKRNKGAYELSIEKPTYPVNTIQIPTNRSSSNGFILSNQSVSQEMMFHDNDSIQHIIIKDIIVKAQRDPLPISKADINRSYKKEDFKKIRDIEHIVMACGILNRDAPPWIMITGKTINPYIVVDWDDRFSVDINKMLTVQAKVERGEVVGIILTMEPGYIQGRGAVAVNQSTITPLGYQKKVEFYSPKYEISSATDNSKRDLRSTLYWNPNINNDNNGKSQFEFYAADIPTTYSVVIEGITPDGRLIHNVSKIERQ